MFIPVFAVNNGSLTHRYTRRLILPPISAARPWIELCTKNGGQKWGHDNTHSYYEELHLFAYLVKPPRIHTYVH